MKYLLALAAGLALSLPSAASAQFSEKDVVGNKIKTEPGAAFIFLHGKGRQGGAFIRVPDDKDIESYRTDREKAFAEAKKKYEKQLKKWESDVRTAKKAKTKIPEKPVEPKEETFSIGPIEQRTAIHFGPDYAFSKDRVNDRFSYLVAVRPGTYIWYGPVIYDDQQGFIGLCYCMGSVKFEVKPDTITNVGNYLWAAPRGQDQKSAPLLDIRHSGGLNGFKVEPPVASSDIDFSVPASLEKWRTVVKPEFSANGKFDNFYGVMISRLPPVPGVLAYQRDQVIVVKSGAVVKNGY